MTKKILKTLFIVNLLILDLVLGYFIYDKYYQNEKSNLVQISSAGLTESQIVQAEACDKDCKESLQSEIDNLNLKYSKLAAAIVSPTPISKSVNTTVPAKTKIKSASYIPIPGSGSTLNTSWTEVVGTDFYISKSDYPGLVGIYFEANTKLINGNGKAFLRIYDKTHDIAATGSEIETSSQTSTFVGSGTISLWEGFNHYVVQAKSLTSDTTVFESGKLKIITEN